MATSRQPRASDLVQIYRLIGECRELWYDWRAWRRHLLGRLCRHVGARGGISGEADGFRAGAPTIARRMSYGRGGAAGHEDWQGFVAQEFPTDDPIIHWALGFTKPAHPGSRLAPCSWNGCGKRIVPIALTPRIWRRAYGLDECLCSYRPLRAPRAGAIDVIELHREAGDRRFGRREARIVNWLHHEIEPMIGRQLASARQPSMSELPTRLREVLLRLLDGDSEKQVSARLSLSGPTVHEYVQALYRRFGVESRAELMARWIRLFPAGEPADQTRC
jgi:DNA-binding CsgD family transcriptional regulator